MADTAAGVLQQVLTAIGSALMGFLAALVTFRTRLAMSDERARTRRRSDDERYKRIERRQRMTLRIILDVAKKLNADHRVTDEIARELLGEEGE